MALSISSPAFDHGDPIPRKYGYTEANVNPPLEISGVPDDARSLAIVVDDPDAVEPAGKVWDHWVVWNVDPEVGRIPEDWDASGATEGRNDYGENGYGGPNPPDREHTYRFACYALEDRLNLQAGATTAELDVAMNGLVVDEAVLEGTYEP